MHSSIQVRRLFSDRIILFLLGMIIFLSPNYAYARDEYTVFDIVVGAIFTWGFGLAPSLIARYKIYKEPLPKKKANWIAGVSCSAFFVVFIFIHAAVGGRPNPLPWVVIFFISRWIMTRQPKNKMIQSQP